MALSVIKTKTLSHPARPRQDLPASNATNMCPRQLVEQTCMAKGDGAKLVELCRSFWGTPSFTPPLKGGSAQGGSAQGGSAQARTTFWCFQGISSIQVFFRRAVALSERELKYSSSCAPKTSPKISASKPLEEEEKEVSHEGSARAAKIMTSQGHQLD